MSCYRDLNSGPLPYQGSALPLSYNSEHCTVSCEVAHARQKERFCTCSIATLSGKRGSNPRPPAWKASALSTELFPQDFLFGSGW